MNTSNGKTATKGTSDAPASTELMNYVWVGGIAYILYRILMTAYQIRLGAIDEYGPVIHEFDPYFNYRATEVCSEIVFGCHFCFGSFQFRFVPNMPCNYVPIVEFLVVVR